MFTVHQIDQIKCDIIWNGQSMRFDYQHITQVLPHLFQKDDINKEFGEGEGKQLEDIYKQFINDKSFEFHKQLMRFT